MYPRILPILFALACAGCTATAQRQPVAMPFTGTWHQAPTSEANQVPVGFLGIDGEQLLFNLDGLPRGPVTIVQNDTDAGLRSGRLVCADGRVLYLAVGDSLTSRASEAGHLLAPTVHLDVHIFAPGAGPGDAPQRVLRLWPSIALAIATLPIRPPTVPAATSATPAPASNTPPTALLAPIDQHFVTELTAVHDPFLRTLATTLLGARQDGLSAAELDALFRRCMLVVRGDLVRDLEAAHQGEHTALTRADQRLDDLRRTDRAYQDWRSGH